MTLFEVGAPVLGKHPDVIPVSNSEIQTFKSCRRKWWLAYYRGMRPKTYKVTGPLALGTRIHVCLEEMYGDNRDPLEVHAKLIEEDREKLLLEERDVTELENEAELGRIMLEGYLEWLEESGADANLEVVGAEKRVHASLMNGKVEIKGKLDARVLRKTDNVRLFIDHKALHVDTGVLTPTGFRRIGDLCVGDEVTAPDGSVTRVTGVYPQGIVDLYDVTFNDHTTIQACADHLWQVVDQAGHKAVLKTSEMLGRVRNKWGQHRWHVPLVAPMKVQLEQMSSELPVDPYIMGVLLGDGCRRTVSFSSWDAEIPAEVRRRLPDHLRLTSTADGHGHFIRGRVSNDDDGDSYKRNPLQRYLKREGLWDTYAYQKMVPAEYLMLNAEARLDLLRGLMDTDGFVKPGNNAVGFTSTSETLRDQVAWIVRSLGGIATCQKLAKPGRIGERKYRPVHVVSIRLPEDICPFILPRKVAQFEKVNRRIGKRKIVSIEASGQGEAVCIEVAHEDSLYVAENFTVTHNTCQNFSDLTRQAHMDEQLLMYHLLEALQPDETERCDGGIFNMLRKVKRTASARPPFYERLEVRHNKHTLNAFWRRLHGTVSTMVAVREALDKGGDPMVNAYPTPTRDCHWKCEFYAVCPLFDDGSAAETMLDDYYEPSNPYDRYEETAKVNV